MKRFRIAGFRLRIRGPAIFTVALAFGLLAAPSPSDGQQPAKVYRIGYLAIIGPPPAERTAQNCHKKGGTSWQAMVEGLRENGYIQGQNLIIECRFTEGHSERAPALAAELVNLKVDLLVVFATGNVRAAKQATSTVPIIMYGVIDPVGRGLVASLARPGGNVTGLTEDAGTQIAAKALQLLKEAVPTASRVAVFPYASNASDPLFVAETQAAARALNVTLQPYVVAGPEKLEGAFAAITKARAEALLVLPDYFVWTHAQRIVDLAAKSRLPAVYPSRTNVEAGGLMSYGLYNIPGISLRIGVYADKIFKGAKPGDLPVEQPTKFELVINLKTAKALGLTIPQSLLLQADEVIQ